MNRQLKYVDNQHPYDTSILEHECHPGECSFMEHSQATQVVPDPSLHKAAAVTTYGRMAAMKTDLPGGSSKD